MDGLLLIPIIGPVLAGAFLLAASFAEHRRTPAAGGGAAERGSVSGQGRKGRPKALSVIVMTVLSVSAGGALFFAWSGERSLTLFSLVDTIPVFFRVDGVSRFFVTLVSVVWMLAGMYSLVYMEREGEQKRFFGFYLMLYGVLVGLDFSGNLVTMYLFYELMTIVSFPLVLHNGTKEAVMASLKYLFYSLCGAYGGLFGIYILYRYCDSLVFTAGGTLGDGAAGHEGILLIAVFAMLIGFGAKAGMFPLHAWLPAAHPVAPSPASAVLSGVIVKSGVLAVIRVVYQIAGPELIRGTWVQYAWMSLTLLTVFMGSLLAFREKVFKKRLAYSTVSQVSYILFGLSLLSPMGAGGALLHTAGHGVIKTGLFLTAGVFLYECGYTRVEQLGGLGKKMPVTLWCYTVLSLGLVGIPPTVGFLSKWYLAQGALSLGKMFGPGSSGGGFVVQDIGIFSWLGPAVLLVSALLTAGYLLPVSLRGFFPGEGGEEPGQRRKEPSLCMLFPLIALAGLTLLLGLWPQPLVSLVNQVVEGMF